MFDTDSGRSEQSLLSSADLVGLFSGGAVCAKDLKLGNKMDRNH